MGKWVFSRMVGLIAPFSGSIGAKVEMLQPGHGVVTLKDRRKVRNHLKSVHAIALVNLAELVTGLTLMNSLKDDTRGILTAIQMQYHKKARGLLTAECFCDVPDGNAEKEIVLCGEIKDETGEVVATATATWLIGPENHA
jgi:acyl-coenzyme A thioesterase PaaI-like protein